MKKSIGQKYADAFKQGVERGNSITDTRRIVGDRLREIRMQRQLTQRDIADQANINPTTYSGYENKISQPTVAALVRIADVYNVSLDYLAGRTENIYGLYVPDDFNASQQSNNEQELKERVAKLESICEKLLSEEQ